MDEVKRYEPQEGVSIMITLASGGFNLHTDYAKLEAERDAWKRLVKAYRAYQNEIVADDASEYIESLWDEVVYSGQALRDLGVME